MVLVGYNEPNVIVRPSDGRFGSGRDDMLGSQAQRLPYGSKSGHRGQKDHCLHPGYFFFLFFGLCDSRQFTFFSRGFFKFFYLKQREFWFWSCRAYATASMNIEYGCRYRGWHMQALEFG